MGIAIIRKTEREQEDDGKDTGMAGYLRGGGVFRSGEQDKRVV
jgi:hypothetical protein